MALKTVIIDDEKIAIKSLENLCKKISTLDLKASFVDPIEALSYVTKESIDLILLDIEMPELTGLELLDKLPSLPQVIFTTSNKEYAYEAFEYEVTDFIKKPITKDRFLKSIQKAISRDSYLKEIARDSNLKEIYVRVDGRLVRITIDDILYFENVGDYVKVITTDKVHVINIALKHLHVKLNHPRLLKVHRSYIVNMDKIKDIQENTLVINKKVIPISRAHKAIVMNSINIIN
jgi:DNA-binding LytR/AlgR family response regulator